MRGRINSEGQIVFPARGKPPPCPDGFIRIEKYKCQTDLSCDQFEMKDYTCPKGNTSKRPWCKKNNLWITKAWCLKCQRPELFQKLDFQR